MDYPFPVRRHSTLGLSGHLHHPYAWVVATEDDIANLGPFKPEDQLKTAFVLSTGGIWTLRNYYPIDWIVLEGIDGPQGDQGATGEDGIPGPAGGDGAQGKPGVLGPVGPIGSAGNQGPVGSVGPVGPRGDKGDKGEPGSDGPAGTTGPIGPVGDVGPIGEVGETGEKGDQGLRGVLGPVGKTGYIGPLGPIGADGPKGELGVLGPVGPSADGGGLGPVGVTGPKGPKGEQGVVGAVGYPGPKGRIGPSLFLADDEEIDRHTTDYKRAILVSSSSTSDQRYSTVIASNESSVEGIYATILSSNNSNVEGTYNQINSSKDSSSTGISTQINASNNVSMIVLEGNVRAYFSQINASDDSSGIIGSFSQVNASSNSSVSAKPDANTVDENTAYCQINASQRSRLGESVKRVHNIQINASRNIDVNNSADDDLKTYASIWGYRAVGTPNHANIKVVIDSKSGNITAEGFNVNGADYAEYFENATGKEIPLGTIVAQTNGKVAPAKRNQDILGVVSATAGVIGNESSFAWNNRYLKGEFGEDITETVKWASHLKYEGIYSECPEELLDEVEVSHKEVPVENPDYDPDAEYLPRSKRPDEWTVVGLMGQVLVRVNEEINKPYINVDGKGTDNETRLKVMKVTKQYDAATGYGVVLCFLR